MEHRSRITGLIYARLPLYTATIALGLFVFGSGVARWRLFVDLPTACIVGLFVSGCLFLACGPTLVHTYLLAFLLGGEFPAEQISCFVKISRFCKTQSLFAGLGSFLIGLVNISMEYDTLTKPSESLATAFLGLLYGSILWMLFAGAEASLESDLGNVARSRPVR